MTWPRPPILALGALAIGWFLATHIGRSAEIPEPRLVPVHTLVTAHEWDTLRLVAVATSKPPKADTTLLERTVAATPKAIPATIGFLYAGVTDLRVGHKRGDSTTVVGFTLVRDSSGAVTVAPWLDQFWTPGPLASLHARAGGADVEWAPAPKSGLRCGKSVTIGLSYGTAGVGAGGTLGVGCVF